MQTTLLGFAIAIILALLAALVGPLLIDWGSYRSEFEARASRLTGLDFRVTGAIDARLLPTPTLMLQGIEFGRPNEGGKVRARTLRIEFALGALVRGEWRIADASLDGPEFAAELDDDGRLAWPAPKIGFDLEGVSIERLKIGNGRAVLADAASGSRIVLEKLEFKGEVRSLAGPVKGEGSFVVAGQHYPYRIAATRVADDGGVKVRLTVDPIDRPLTADIDVSIWIERGMPRFDGSMQLARAVGRAPAGAQSLVIEPWRVASRLRGTSTAAVLEQIEFQYGPDERAIKLKGNANVTFGRRPEINGVLSSPQIDLDRLLALPDATRRRPLAAIRALAEAIVGAQRLPIPTTLSIGIEAVTLGGATLQRVGADVKADADGLDVTALEVRAPGITQIRLSGRLGATATGVQFTGSTRVEASDPRALLAWLTERTDAPVMAAGPLRLGGDVALGGEVIAIERLKLELDRMTIAGRLAYAFPSDDRPARLDAALTSPDVDLDRAHAFAKAMFGGAAFDWPREGALSLKIARAAVVGVEAKQVDVSMRIDANGLEIDRLAVADFGGAALAVKGRIEAQSPRGAMTLDLDARSLDGVLALAEKFAPRATAELRRSASRFTPATLRASLALDPGAPGSVDADAKFKIDGRAGAFRIALVGDAGAVGDAFKIDNLGALAAAKVDLSGRLENDDGEALLELVGLDRFVAVDKRPGRLTLAAIGPLDGEMAVEGQLAAGGLAVSTNGTLRVFGRESLRAGLALRVANANLVSPRPPAAGRPAELLPASVTARLGLAEGTLRLTDVAGTVAGTSVGGKLVIGVQQAPMTLDGDIELGAVDLPVAIAVALGMPAQSASTGTNATANANAFAALWPAEPFEEAWRPLSGHVAVKSARVALTPKLAARDVRGVVHFGEAQLAVQVIDADMAGGRMAGELIFLRSNEGLLARSRIKLTGVEAAELLPGDGSLAGRLTLDVSAEGAGRSPVALIGSLAGSGTFMLENARLSRLDPAAFGAVIRAADQGLAVDAVRVRDRVDAALARDSLAVTLAEGTITINAGQAQLSNVMARAQGADLAVSGSVNLAEGALDARFTLLGAGGPGAPANTRPEIMVALKGPIDAPKRSVDAAAFASWLALRAVEQQSKKLDVLEGREAAPNSPAGDAAQQPAPAPDAAAVDTTAPAAPAEPDASRLLPPVRSPPATSSVQKPKPTPPSAEQAQPPPIDIRPAPASRTPRQQSGAAAAPSGQTPPPKSATTPARPRSLSEILFGN